SKCARNQPWSDDGEHELIDHKGLDWDCCSVVRIWSGPNASKKEILKSPKETVTCSEREAVTEERPQHGNYSHQRKALHHRCQHVFLTNQPAIEQSQPRPSHHEHQRRADKHPGVVSRTFSIRHLLLKLCKARGRIRGRARGSARLGANALRKGHNQQDYKPPCDRPVSVRH